MSTAPKIRTYVEGQWQDGNAMIMAAADHGSWLGTTVFDGARYFDGVAPDLRAHCDRVNHSARALMLNPFVEADEMVEIVWEGLRAYDSDTAVYIRPMYWAIERGYMAIMPADSKPGFAVCLEEIPMPGPDVGARLTTTRFRRPVMEDGVVNAKAGCLYPNNARMLAEARARGYDNALVLDATGNVAETATANIFMVRDGAVFTPIPNGTFLAGITRARHIVNLRADGMQVHEAVLSYEDFRQADEVFMSGNMAKVTPVSEFDGTHYQHGPVARRARALYWDWAKKAQG